MLEIDGEFLNNLRFADEIFLNTILTPSYKNYPLKVAKWVGRWS